MRRENVAGPRKVSKRARETRVALALSLSACAGLWSGAALAQAAADTSGANASPPVQLPPMVVEGKKQTQAKPKKPQQQKPAAASIPAPQQKADPSAKAETGTGPVNGIVATRSATGTKTDTPLIETPQSISVVTADRMTQQGATTINEALGYTAGVLPGVYGLDTRFDWISIRGFDAYQPGFFIDGMLSRNNNSWAVQKVEPYGAERIEVLKGPPSVLYGQGNVGGMVNVISKRPLDEPLNEVQVRVGSHNRVESDFDFSGPATSDGKVLYRLTGVVLDTNSQMDFVEQKEVYIAPAVTWRPTTGTSLTLLGQYRKDDTLPAPATYLPDPHSEIRRNLFVGEPDHDKFNREQWSTGYLFEHRIDSVWQVRQNLRFTSINADYKTVYGLGSSDGGVTLDRKVFVSDETSRLFTTDSQAEGKFVTGNVKHTVLAGLDYQLNRYDQRSGGAAVPGPFYLNNPNYGGGLPDPVIDTDADTTLSQTGLYLQEQAKIAERLIVTLGGRYDWAKTDLDDRGAANGDANKTDEAFTWRGAVLYHDASGLSPYYSYSKSFFPQSGSGQLFEPETGQQHEVGVKYEIPGVKSLFTLAGFDITRQNYLTYDANNNYLPRASGEIRSRGIEFEGAVEPVPGLEILAAYTWLPTFEIIKSSNSSEVGQRQPIVPEHSGSLWMHYQLQAGVMKGFGFGGGVRYIGESFGDVANSQFMTVPDFTLFDAVVDYETEDWRFAVNATNLADEDTFTCWGTCYLGAGRNVMATVRRRW